MRNSRKRRVTQTRFPAIGKGVIFLLCLCLFLRIAVSLGADSAAEKFMSGIVQSGGVANGILNFELGGANSSRKSSTGLSALLFESPLLGTNSDAIELREGEDDSAASPSQASSSPEATPKADVFDVSAPTSSGSAGNAAVFSNAPGQALNSSGLSVKNETDYTLDLNSLLNDPLKISLSGSGPSVLILHTHGSEAYTPDANDPYKPSDTFRTEDPNHSVMRVGDELAKAFQSSGISVIHDKGLYDYPSYNGCYSRAYDVIESYLKKYPSIKIVIDLHRDAIEAPDGSQYKTVAQIGDVTCSQVMIDVGTDASGLDDPNWRQNLKLALRLQYEMNALYPTLSKPINLSKYRYNMQATTGSILVEVGSAGNTLQESLTAVKYFADAASRVILGLQG